MSIHPQALVRRIPVQPACDRWRPDAARGPIATEPVIARGPFTRFAHCPQLRVARSGSRSQGGPGTVSLGPRSVRRQAVNADCSRVGAFQIHRNGRGSGLVAACVWGLSPGSSATSCWIRARPRDLRRPSLRASRPERSGFPPRLKSVPCGTAASLALSIAGRLRPSGLAFPWAGLGCTIHSSETLGNPGKLGGQAGCRAPAARQQQPSADTTARIHAPAGMRRGTQLD